MHPPPSWKRATVTVPHPTGRSRSRSRRSPGAWSSAKPEHDACVAAAARSRRERGCGADAPAPRRPRSAPMGAGEDGTQVRVRRCRRSRRSSRRTWYRRAGFCCSGLLNRYRCHDPDPDAQRERRRLLHRHDAAGEAAPLDVARLASVLRQLAGPCGPGRLLRNAGDVPGGGRGAVCADLVLLGHPGSPVRIGPG